MENVKDISFDENGNPTITLNDGTVTSYVPVGAAADPITSITLQPGQSFTVSAAAAA